MTLPAGIQTKTLSIGRPFDALGDIGVLKIEVTPVFGGTAQRLVWSATGDTLEAFTVIPPAETAPDGDPTETIDLPIVDQAGWLDGSGNTITGWSYQVSVTPGFVVNGLTKRMKTYTKYVSPLSTMSSPIDMDKLPDGTAASPTLAPGPVARQVEVTPEDFAGATDDLQFAAAVTSLATTGGVIRLTAGKSYAWVNPVGPVDFATTAPIHIDATRAKVTYTGTGAAFTGTQSTAPADLRTLTVQGGEWVAATQDAFFLLQDVCNAKFRHCRANVPAGAFVHLSNVAYWSERNEFHGIDDYNCREVVRFSVDGSTHLSFARTVVRDLWLQGGVSGYPKLNIVDSASEPSVYDSVFDGVRGNINDGVIVAKLAGSMNGTRLRGFQVEAPSSATTAAYFLIGSGQGAMTGVLPVLEDGPPTTTSHSMVLFSGGFPTSRLPFTPTFFPNGLASYGAITSGRLATTLASAGAATFDVSRANRVNVVLQANCTGVTLSNSPTAPTGTGGSWSQMLTVSFTQDATGGRTYVWPTTCHFAGGAAPSDATANTVTSVTFIYDTGVWYEVGRAVAVPL